MQIQAVVKKYDILFIADEVYHILLMLQWDYMLVTKVLFLYFLR